MLFPSGTPADGDVATWVGAAGRSEWLPPAGGSASSDIQNQLNALAYGQGIPLAVSPSYDNTGGQGDRRSIIAVTASGLDGDPELLVNGIYFNPLNGTGTGGAAGKFLRFEFAVAVLITEISMDMGATAGEGVWKYQGSQDGSTWVDLTTTFTLKTPTGTGSGGGANHAARTNQLVTAITNPYAWKNYRLLGVSGTCNQSYLNQVEFKILGLE